MSKTKILLWHWGRRGGGPRYTLELARELARHPELELHLSLSRQSEWFAPAMALGLPGFHVDTYSDLQSAVLALVQLPQVRQGFRHYLKAQQIQVVHCTMSHLWNLALLPALKAAGARYLLTLHDATPHPGDDFLVRRWLLGQEIRGADGIITLTAYVQERLQQLYRYPTSQSWVIPHGVFPYAGLKPEPRVYPTDRKLRLLFFGRILPYKGLALLLEAWPLVQAQFPQVELAIVGQGDLTPYTATLTRLTGLQVENRWIQEPEIGGIFQQADLVVLPYREASQSGVVAIALTGGIPLVATPVGGLQEQVRDRQTGLIARSVSAEAIAAAILELLQNPALYEHCSRTALQEARETLSWRRIAAQVATVVQQIAQPSKT